MGDYVLSENARKTREIAVPFQQVPRSATGVALSTSHSSQRVGKLDLKIDKAKLKKANEPKKK